MSAYHCTKEEIFEEIFKLLQEETGLDEKACVILAMMIADRMDQFKRSDSVL